MSLTFVSVLRDYESSWTAILIWRRSQVSFLYQQRATLKSSWIDRRSVGSLTSSAWKNRGKWLRAHEC